MALYVILNKYHALFVLFEIDWFVYFIRVIKILDIDDFID